MKYNQSKNCILAIVLIITLLSTAYSAVETSGGSIGASLQTDASIPFEDIPVVDNIPEVTPMVTEIPEVIPMITEVPEVTPMVTEVPEVIPMVTEIPEVTPMVTEVPEVTETPEMEPVVTDTPVFIDSFDSDETSTQQNLPANSIIVYEYVELVSALSGDNGIETVYLGQNIVSDLLGIPIHASKRNVIIDGHPPGTADDTNYIFTQMNSRSPFATIFLEDENMTTKNITLQNITLQGDNSNGIIFIPDSISNVNICYQNVSFIGPQVVSNPRGSVQLINSSFEMFKDVLADTQYVAEANYIQLSGSIEIKRDSKSNQILNAVFLPTSDNPRLEVSENANVNIHDFGYLLDIDVETANIIIQDHAIFEVAGRIGFTQINQNIRNITINPYASVTLTKSSPQTYGTLRVEETLKMEQGSELFVTRLDGVGCPIVFPLAGGKAIFNNPERVYLQSFDTPIISFVENGTLEINTSVINLWSSNSPINEDNPEYIWNNSDNRLLTLNATYVNDEPTNFIHNLDADAPITDDLTSSIFNLSTMELLTFGHRNLSVNPVCLTDNSITGLTDVTGDGSKVAVNATYDGLLEPLGEQLTGNGSFSFSIDPKTLSPQNVITVTSYIHSLTKREMIFPSGQLAGDLTFLEVPNNINFDTISIPATPTTIPRASENFSFSVMDTRSHPEPWRVDAHIVSPLSANLPDNRIVTLPEALVFVDNLGEHIPLSSAPLPIYYGEGTTAGKFDITWNENRGILLDISPSDIYSNVSYNTTIHWTLVTAP